MADNRARLTYCLRRCANILRIRCHADAIGIEAIGAMAAQRQAVYAKAFLSEAGPQFIPAALVVECTVDKKNVSAHNRSGSNKSAGRFVNRPYRIGTMINSVS